MWQVCLDPKVGQELQKTRLGVVLGIPAAMQLRVRLVALMSEWKDAHEAYLWRVRLDISDSNGLHKPVAVQPEHIRCLALGSFIEPVCRLNAVEYQEVKSALAIFLGIE